MDGGYSIGYVKKCVDTPIFDFCTIVHKITCTWDSNVQ